LAARTRRLAIARLSHEGNSFTPLVTDRAAFRRREWAAGDAAVAFYRGTHSELGAAVDWLDSHGDWRGTFLRCCAAPPGGPVAQDLLDAIRDEILRGLAGQSWDAIYLSLHGAMIGTGDPAPDLALVQAVRAAVGPAPLAVTLDLHANLDPAMARAADIVTGYRTYPHVDTYETAARALGLLARAADGKIAPVSHVEPVGALLGSFNMRTEAGPMAEVEARAEEIAAARGLLDLTPLGGFAYGDVPWAGASVVACADGDQAAARSAARDLAAFFRARRDAFQIALPGPEAALGQALELADAGPVAVLEPADNPMSGGIGDTPGLFRALLAARPPVPTVFAFFWDPGLVARAHAAGLGAALSCSLGGRLTADYGPPVPVEARVAGLTEGRFVNQGPMETGLPVDLGPTALLEVDGIAVIVTSACQSPNDPGYFALHGLDPARPGLVCVKAKNHFRAAFGSVFRRIVDCDSAGPAALDLARLPFRHVPRERLPRPGPGTAA